MNPAPQLPRPQLLMWYRHDQAPSLGALPTGYQLRGYQAGDEAAWAALLQANGQLGEWDVHRVRGELDGALVQQGQRFAAHGQQLVATAGVYQRERAGTAMWEIGWVACHPEHGGRGLGAHVTAAAVAAALALPRRPIYLLTDDHRTAALKTYLRLGFTPDMGEPSYAPRWRDILERLGPAYAVYSPLVTAAAGAG